MTRLRKIGYSLLFICFIFLPGFSEIPGVTLSSDTAKPYELNGFVISNTNDDTVIIDSTKVLYPDTFAMALGCDYTRESESGWFILAWGDSSEWAADFEKDSAVFRLFPEDSLILNDFEVNICFCFTKRRVSTVQGYDYCLDVEFFSKQSSDTVTIFADYTPSSVEPISQKRVQSRKGVEESAGFYNLLGKRVRNPETGGSPSVLIHRKKQNQSWNKNIRGMIKGEELRRE